MTATEKAAACDEGDGRRGIKTLGACTPTAKSPADQQRDRVLAVLRAAYRAAVEEQERVADDIVTIVAIARAIETGAVDPAVGLARAVELGLVALDEVRSS